MRRAALTLAMIVTCATSASAAGNMSGTYMGRYQCARINRLELRVNDDGGRLTATFTFTPQGMAQSVGAYSMTGQYDSASGRFHLEPQPGSAVRPRVTTWWGCKECSTPLRVG